MASRYWVGGGSSTNWNATVPTNWSATDGGANDASVPANGDDVFLKSSANCNLSASTANLNSFDMTGYTGTFSTTATKDIIINPATGTTVTCKLEGTFSGATFRLAFEPVGTATINFTSGGKIPSAIFMSGYLGFNTGTVSQQDAVTTGLIEHYATGWNTNGYAVTANGATGYIWLDDTRTRTVNITNSTVTVSGTGSGNPWKVTATGLTFTTTGSTIVLSNASATAKTFTGGAQTYATVTFSGDNITIVGNNTFSTLNVNTAGLTNGLIFTINSTQTVLSVNGFTTNGSSGNLAKILSTVAGTNHVLSSSFNQTLSYMSIKDSTATGGGTWTANFSTDVSGNSGWLFPTVTSLSVSGYMTCNTKYW